MPDPQKKAIKAAPKRNIKPKKRPKAGAKRGRPAGSIILTPEIHDRIVLTIKAGNYIETAAAVAGISKDTFYSWLKEGARVRDKIAPSRRTKAQLALANFSDAVEKALHESEAIDVMVVGQAAQGYQVTKTKEVYERVLISKGAKEGEEDVYQNVLVSTSAESSTRRDWQAAAWRLERRFPKRWGRKVAVEVTEGEQLPAAAAELDEANLGDMTTDDLRRSVFEDLGRGS